MWENVILGGVKWAAFSVAILTFVLVRCLYRENGSGKRILSTYRDLQGLLREKQKESGRYRRLENWLTSNGAGFHYGKGMTPGKFIALRFTLAAVGAFVLLPLNPAGALVGAVVLYYLPGGMLEYLNARDNEHLLPEIKLVYNALELQIRAGVYVTDALAECYGSVRERRLRGALLDLAGDIVMRADICDALEKFQGKFDNPYIDTLCITILQALESGQAVELLADIGEQIRDMEQAVMERKKAALDRSLTFYQLGILTVVLGIALYVCVIHMMGAAIQF